MFAQDEPDGAEAASLLSTDVAQQSLPSASESSDAVASSAPSGAMPVAGADTSQICADWAVATAAGEAAKGPGTAHEATPCAADDGAGPAPTRSSGTGDAAAACPGALTELAPQLLPSLTSDGGSVFASQPDAAPAIADASSLQAHPTAGGGSALTAVEASVSAGTLPRTESAVVLPPACASSPAFGEESAHADAAAVAASAPASAVERAQSMQSMPSEPPSSDLGSAVASLAVSMDETRAFTSFEGAAASEERTRDSQSASSGNGRAAQAEVSCAEDPAGGDAVLDAHGGSRHGARVSPILGTGNDLPLTDMDGTALLEHADTGSAPGAVQASGSRHDAHHGQDAMHYGVSATTQLDARARSSSSASGAIAQSSGRVLDFSANASEQGVSERSRQAGGASSISVQRAQGASSSAVHTGVTARSESGRHTSNIESDTNELASADRALAASGVGFGDGNAPVEDDKHLRQGSSGFGADAPAHVGERNNDAHRGFASGTGSVASADSAHLDTASENLHGNGMGGALRGAGLAAGIGARSSTMAGASTASESLVKAWFPHARTGDCSASAGAQHSGARVSHYVLNLPAQASQ